MTECKQCFFKSLQNLHPSTLLIVESASTTLGSNVSFVERLIELCATEDHAGVKGRFILHQTLYDYFDGDNKLMF